MQKIKTQPRHNDDHTGEDLDLNRKAREKLIEHLRVVGYGIKLGKGQNNVIEINKNGQKETLLMKCLNVRIQDEFDEWVIAKEVCLLEKGTLKPKPIALANRKIDTVVIALNFDKKLEFLFFSKSDYMELIESRSKDPEITNSYRKCYNKENPATLCCQTGCNVLKRATTSKDPNRVLSRFYVKELKKKSQCHRSVMSMPIPVKRKRTKPLPTCFA